MVFVDINLVPRASFLTHSDWLAFASNQSLCVRKEALGTRFSRHALLGVGVGVRAYNGVLQTTPPPPPNHSPAAMFASQGNAHLRTDAQIKFPYHPLTV